MKIYLIEEVQVKNIFIIFSFLIGQNYVSRISEVNGNNNPPDNHIRTRHDSIKIKDTSGNNNNSNEFNNHNKNNQNNIAPDKYQGNDIILALSNNNVIFKHMLYLITEQEFKFKHIENKLLLDDYIKNLDNTPVYITYNCGILYIPNKGNYFLINKLIYLNMTFLLTMER